MKSPIPYTYDLNTKSAQKVICVTHTDDNSVDVIKLHVVQGGTLIDFSGNTIIARMVMSRTHELLSDNVVCTIDDETKDVMIPIDRKAVSTRKGLMLIEVNVRGVLPETLTLQFPLLVRVNGSILDDAEITPESQGTIPELLIAAAEELERVQGFITADDVYDILDSTLQGAQNVTPSLYVKIKGDNYALVYEDSNDVLHELFDFSNLPSGTSDYTSLENKPQINSHTLSGNQSSDDLGLQKKLTAGTNITIENDGTISASGGVTSYNDLTDKPVINIPVYSAGQFVGNEDVDIEDTIYMGDGFALQKDQSNKYLVLKEIKIYDLYDNLQFVVGQPSYLTYDFNAPIAYNRAGIFRLWKGRCSHVPSFINDYFVIGSSNYDFFVVHLQAPGDNSKIRAVVGKDKNGDLRFLIQQIQLDDNGTITSQTDWLELGSGGSQLVSGVVNQNGTITFTDSDRNTFTTSGSSVIGADGVGIADVHIDGGGDLIIEYTTGHMENVGHVVGADGQDYVLTAQDKSDIADIVLSKLPTTQGVLYGNTSN